MTFLLFSGQLFEERIKTCDRTLFQKETYRKLCATRGGLSAGEAGRISATLLQGAFLPVRHRIFEYPRLRNFSSNPTNKSYKSYTTNLQSYTYSPTYGPKHLYTTHQIQQMNQQVTSLGLQPWAKSKTSARIRLETKL
jgi:hypothetical protein